jgi:hypothetical protein
MRLLFLATAALILAGGTVAKAADTKFWNLTAHTVDNFQMAPAGSTAFGANLCLADKDKSVDSDERLKLAGIQSGRYDIKLADTTGRMCTVKNVAVAAGKVFSISEKELTGCTP